MRFDEIDAEIRLRHLFPSSIIRVTAMNSTMARPTIFKIAAGDMDIEEFIKQCQKSQQIISEVSEISEAITNLASESFINGILLPVDRVFALNWTMKILHSK